MNEWQKHIEARRAEKYPDIKLAALRPCDDLQKKAFDEANAHPQRPPGREADHGHLLARPSPAPPRRSSSPAGRT